MRVSTTAARLGRLATFAMAAILAASVLGAPQAHASGLSVKATKASTGKVTVVKGKKYNLGVKATAGAKLSFKSSDKKVATVTKKGVVKAKRSGKATITITAKKGGVKATKKVRATVVSKSAFKKVRALKVYSDSRSLRVGETTRINPAFKPVNATNRNLEFTSSNPSVAKVAPNGTVKALSAGKATITVRSADNPKARAKVKVAVLGKRWVVDQEAYDEQVPLFETHHLVWMKSGHSVFVLDDDPETLYLDVKKVTTDAYAEVAPHQLLNTFYTTEGVETLKLPDAYGGRQNTIYSYDELHKVSCPWLDLVDLAVWSGYDVDRLCNRYGTSMGDIPYEDLSDAEKARYRSQLEPILAKLKEIDDECDSIYHTGDLCKINNAWTGGGDPLYFLTGFKTVHHEEIGHWE